MDAVPIRTKMENEEGPFLFNLDGLIKGEYFRIETDSAEVISEIIKLMDSHKN